MAILKEIGLSDAEIIVYSALLKLGFTTSGKISKETNLRKSTIYDCLHRLAQKGLVGHSIINSVTCFQATEPEKLLDFIQEKKKLLENSEEKIKAFLPSLRELYGSDKPHAEARIFQGTDGFKTIRNDILRIHPKEILMIGAIFREDKVLPFFFEQWNKQRIRDKIKMKILAKKKTEDTPVKDTTLMEIRYLPASICNPVVINVYSDRVVSIVWKEKEPICFMVTNKEISEAYKSYFKLLWKISK